MIKKTEMEAILRKIQDSVHDNFYEDMQTMVDNLEIQVFDKSPNPIPEDVKLAIRAASTVILDACNSVCISHDAATIQAVMDYIRKSL